MSTYVVSDSTLWFALDQDLESIGLDDEGREILEHKGWRKKPLDVWSQIACEMRGESGEWDLARHIRDLPEGSTVLLVAGWNLKRWPREAEAQIEELHSIAVQKSLRVARVSLYEGGADGCWDLEMKFSEGLRDWPVFKEFRNIYAALQPMRYRDRHGVEYHDMSHRVWGAASLETLMEELGKMAKVIAKD